MFYSDIGVYITLVPTTRFFFWDGCLRNILEVKNYDVESENGIDRLINDTASQAVRRNEQLPAGTSQTVVIDVRGQNPSEETLEEIAERIEQETGGIVEEDEVRFITDL